MAISRRDEIKAWRLLTPKGKSGFLELQRNATIRDGVVYDVHGVDKSHRAELVVRTTEKQHRALKARDELSTHEVDNGGFVFALFDSCRTMEERFPSLSQSDLARLMFIGTYTSYKNGRLQHENGRVIGRKQLESLVGMSRARFSEFYRKLLEEEIIHENDGQLFMSPRVFYRGVLSESEYKLDEYQHTRMFRKTVRDLYRNYGGRTIKQLAIIYAVLPFVNFNTNVVCFNPQEGNEDDLKPMDLDNLAALLHYNDTQKLRRALETIKLDNKPVFYLPHNIHNKRRRRIIVNPRVVFAGPAKSLAAIKVLFN
ncbi:hypothetical protein [Paenibacillus alvei]|uniref:Uncharacterized protein n=1 Tax=Paenibacillus alvei TaxID=44250 RepID=A0AAP7A238_PAEAL|nr:hypothetical protein [Paenibacillus alvei]NOJ71417.1 hypothetical protein [Paenibacillus alvei]